MLRFDIQEPTEFAEFSDAVIECWSCSGGASRPRFGHLRHGMYVWHYHVESANVLSLNSGRSPHWTNAFTGK